MPCDYEVCLGALWGIPMRQEITKLCTRVMDTRLIASVVATDIMSFSGIVVETAMNVTFPAPMREFGVDTSAVQWMTTTYLLVLAAIVAEVLSLCAHGGRDRDRT